MKQTALALLVLALPVGWLHGQESRHTGTVTYLRGLQRSDGGFLPAEPQGETPPSSLRATTAALRALKYFGGEPRARAAAAAFVRHCFNKTRGGFADHPEGQPDVPTTAVGAMALAALDLPTDEHRDSIVRYLEEHVKGFEDIRIAVAGLEALHATTPRAADWLEQIARMRHPDGTYGTGDGVARDTGSAVVAVLRLGGKVEHLKHVITALQAGQREDGGFGKAGQKGSDLETAYRVMRAFFMLHASPNAERLTAFVLRCRNPDGGYGVTPGAPSNVGATYHAASVVHWLTADLPPRYEMHRDHDPNGIGKFYLGREIAQVMGHEAADWLDRPEREKEEQPNKLLDALKLKAGDVVADIGAGSGFFTFRLAERIGPTGKVLAVDIQPEMLTIIRQRMKERKVTNIEPILGTETDPKLPAGTVDLILMVDVYHEFADPWEMTRAMVRALKPGGRLVFVEYRKEDPEVAIKLVHKMTEKQVRKEMAPHTLRWVETLESLPTQHIIIFRKEGAPTQPATSTEK
jgi:ubiquinone/menaquinone biosynthesis C-methylase UbiE/prenyltransferase beta subunit